jgi:hypothetical protein
MATPERSRYVPKFEDGADFTEQLYEALRKSPWWMISLAFHVIVFFIAGMMDTGTVKPPPEDKGIQARFVTPDVVDPPIPPQDPIDDVETPNPSNVVPEDPVLRDPKDDTRNEDDVDNLLSHDLYGQSDREDVVSGVFDGPADNSLIGIGGGASPFGKRGAGGGDDLRATNRGGGKKQRDAVEHALRWLAAHQSPDGGWEAAGFDKWCDGKPATGPRPDGLGKALYDPGVTGLALCAFLGAGYSSRGQHEFSKVVSRGLNYLRNVQDPEGCFGPRTTQHYIYNHATAALAMVEAYGMTGSSVLRRPAQKALDFISLARNPYFVWRYGVKPGDNDTSVTGWMMMALKSARIVNDDAVRRGKPAPLLVDDEAFQGIKAWLDKMTDPDYGRVGYVQRGTGPARPQDLVDRFPAEKSESMTAVGMLARIFIGEDPRTSKVVKQGADLCLKLAPTWNPSDGSIDMYYWYYATLAMYQVGGDAWNKWNAAMTTSMVPNQRMDTDYCAFKGSWDPIDPWGGDGGRVYSTALLAMCLEVYYRYDRVIGAR